MPADKIQHFGAALYDALRARKTIAPLIEQDPSLTLDDAYAINLNFLSRRVADGEKVVGKKIGVTSKADRKSTRLNSSHIQKSRMPSSA